MIAPVPYIHGDVDSARAYEVYVPTQRMIALILYSLSLFAGLVYGALYLMRNRFMPYHRAALGRAWEELDLPTRTLILALMKVVGGGVLGCTIAGAFVLAGPFIAGDTWANWALLTTILCSFLPAVYATFLVHAKTGAKTPRVPALAVLAMGTVAFLLCLVQ